MRFDGSLPVARFDAAGPGRSLDADAWHWFAERTKGDESDADSVSEPIKLHPLKPLRQDADASQDWIHEAADAISAMWDSAAGKARTAGDEFFANGPEMYFAELVCALAATAANVDHRG